MLAGPLTLQKILGDTLNPNITCKPAIAAGLTPLQYALHLMLDVYLQAPQTHVDLWLAFDRKHGHKLTLKDYAAVPKQDIHKGLHIGMSAEALALKLGYDVATELIMPFVALNTSKSKYYIHTQRSFCIWFSSNPNEWTNVQNKLRLIRSYVADPNRQVAFVYSSNCLSDETHDDLKAFAKKMNMTLVDFDKDVIASIKNTRDAMLYRNAKEEIKRTLNNTGGNFAGASDCLRAMLGLHMNYGNYIEIDIDFNFSTCGPALPVKRPFVINTNVFGYAKNVSVFKKANNFMALAYTSPQLTDICPEALASLEAQQLQIIENYRNPTRCLSFEVLNGVRCQSIMDLRRVIKDTIPDENSRHNMLVSTVTDISGPATLDSLFPRKKTDFETVEAHSFYNYSHDLCYNGLLRYINDPCRSSLVSITELTWTDAGKNDQDVRDQKILAAVETIERFAKQVRNFAWRRDHGLTKAFDKLKLKAVPIKAISSSSSTSSPPKGLKRGFFNF